MRAVALLLLVLALATGSRASYAWMAICDNNPCLNGGTCINTWDGNYLCICADGFPQDPYINPNCANPTYYACDSSPCQNMGECVNGILSEYTCYCKTGWTGDTCTTPPAECADSETPCLNGGVCACIGQSNYDYMNGVCTQGHKCYCPDGFSGPLCEDLA